MSLNIKQKLFLALLLVVSGILSTYGGFRVNHIDTEYHKTLYNKSYFLHNIYHAVSQIEFEIKKLLYDKRHRIHKIKVQEFKKLNQRHGISLYIVNSFFAMLGVFFCFRLAFLLINHFWLAYLASAILGTSYFWNAEAHYPTTDIALSSLIITSLFFLIHRLIDKEKSTVESKIYEGILLGSCFAVKYAGIIILAPYLYLKLKEKTLKESITSILIAIAFLALCIADKFKKLIHYSLIEYKVQTELGWAGYNSDEAGFIYHLKHSLFTEYGLILSLLSLIGIYFAYNKLKDNPSRYLALQAILVFIVSLSIMISSTVIKTVRFALPLIPFLAIFSAFGIYQIYLLSKKLNLNFAKILITVLIIASIGPSLKNSIRHDSLMANPDTAELIVELRKILAKEGATHILLDDKQLFDKTPNIDDIEYIKRCSTKPKDFRRIFKFDEYPQVVVSTNSYKLDRFIFDKAYHCDNVHKAFKNYEDLKLLQLTPFNVDKSKVPFSFISNFSPRKPDLKYRNYKGGFFEMFFIDPKFEKILKSLCQKERYPCRVTTAKDSYFLSNIQTSFVDPEIREAHKKLKEGEVLKFDRVL